MKLLHLSFLLALFFAVTEGRTEGRKLTSLQDDWTIAGPTATTGITLSGNSLSLTYTVSDAMTDNNIKVPTIWDKGCKAGDNQKEGEAGFVVSVASLSATNGGGLKTSVVTIALTPKLIANDGDLYGTASNGKDGKIDFCFRYMLETESDTEVNFVELLVSINVDLSQDIELDNVTVKPKDQETATEDKEYAVTAFLCDLSTAASTTNPTIPSLKDQGVNDDAFEQGSLVTVCVAPDDASRVDGIVMKSIKDFTWKRSDDATIKQSAIVNAEAVANELTSLACTGQDRFCYFSSVLFADFYKTSGSVTGSGSATMEFLKPTENPTLRPTTSNPTPTPTRNPTAAPTSTPTHPPLLPIATFGKEFDRDTCGCADNEVDGPLAQVPAATTADQFQGIISDYLDGDASAGSPRSKYGNKIGCWDVGVVTSMRNAFDSKGAFNERIGCWNMESVTNMHDMFLSASLFNQDIGRWNVASVNDIGGIFYHAQSFNQDISAWDVVRVRVMNGVFSNANAFNQDISGWVVSSVDATNNMFDGATSFNQNLCDWNIKAAANTDYMFFNSGCPNKNNPSASAKCQSCDRRRLATPATATATAINAADKPNKPVNNNNNKKSKAKRNIVTGRVLQEDATVAAAATAVSSEFDISIGVSKSDNNDDGVGALRTAGAGASSLGMMTTVALISLFGSLIGSAVLFL